MSKCTVEPKCLQMQQITVCVTPAFILCLFGGHGGGIDVVGFPALEVNWLVRILSIHGLRFVWMHCKVHAWVIKHATLKTHLSESFQLQPARDQMRFEDTLTHFLLSPWPKCVHQKETATDWRKTCTLLAWVLCKYTDQTRANKGAKCHCTWSTATSRDSTLYRRSKPAFVIRSSQKRKQMEMSVFQRTGNSGSWTTRVVEGKHSRGENCSQYRSASPFSKVNFDILLLLYWNLTC